MTNPDSKRQDCQGLTLTLKMKEHLLLESNINSFIFNRQHVVQKSLMTFLG